MENNNPKSVGFQGQRERERLPGSRSRRGTEINVKRVKLMRVIRRVESE